MPKKPVSIIYGVDDRPPLVTTIALGFQHVCILFIGLIFPVLIIRQLGDSVDPDTARSYISLTMIAGGLTTILQALKRGPLGSGKLCPAVSGPAYFSATLSAVQIGGLPLAFGMTLAAGVIESLFAPVLRRLRSIFTAEVTGVVVAMIGVVIVPLSVKRFLGVTPEHPALDGRQALIGLVTLAAMIGINVWGKGKLRLFSVLAGMGLGYGISFAAGIVPESETARMASAPWFSIPSLRHVRWAFDFTLLIPFAIATLCSSLKTVGDLTTCQKINDADWRRPDMVNISKGLLADGFGGIIPGLIGGYGQSTSSSNVGLSIATGATSRIIAHACGVILIALAFFPKLDDLFLIMPPPVMGATLIFSVSFMIVTGFQMVMSRMLDARKIFVVGVSIIFGLAADMVPGAYAHIHPWLKPITESSLSMSAVMVLILNLLLRIGIAKTRSLDWTIGQDASDQIVSFMESQGASWGARREIIQKATSALVEINESAVLHGLAGQPAKADATFDELNLNLTVMTPGESPLPPEPPPTREELETEGIDGALKLSHHLIHGLADKVSYSVKDGRTVIKLHFEH